MVREIKGKHMYTLTMNKEIPYCGDCSLSSNNCFYAIEDTSDCWGNEPFCSECPYSLNLTKCIL